MKKISSVSVALLAATLLLAGPALAWDLDLGRAVDLAQGIHSSFRMSEETERAIGQSVAKRMISRYGLYDDPDAVQYINLVGKAVALCANDPDIDKYSFNILDTDQINAFACPGGPVFITRGLWEHIATEAELAGILAHEVVHIDERHVVKEVQKANILSTVTDEALAQTGSEEFGMVVDHIVDDIFTNGLSRTSEYEADRLGTRYAAMVGYYPAGLQEFLARVLAVEDEDGKLIGSLYEGHPSTDDRVERLAELIADEFAGMDDAPQLPERLAAVRAAALPLAEENVVEDE